MDLLKIISTVEWSKICRTCLSDNTDLQSIFDTALNEIVMSCTTLEIKVNDGLPDVICDSCVTQAKAALKFKEQCEKSDSHLRHLLSQCDNFDEDIKSENENCDTDFLSSQNDLDIKAEFEDKSCSYRSSEDNIENTQNATLSLVNEVRPKKRAISKRTRRMVKRRNENENLKNGHCNSSVLSTENGRLNSKSKIDNAVTTSFYKSEEEDPHNTQNGILIVANEELINKRAINKKIKGLVKQSNKNNEMNKDTSFHEDQSECNLCGQLLNDINQSTHEVTCHQPDKHICLSCGKEFIDLKLLKRHLRVHRLQKKHLCNTCGKGFYGANDLVIHTRVHTGEKPLVCNVCGKAFSDPRGLNSHMKIHTGAKPYSCSVCNKRFAHSFVLSTHMRTHTAERPYVCSVCGKTFVYAHNLAIHTRSHTGERPYPCTLCSKAFSSSSTLSAHMMTHTGEKRFVCSVCGKKVARSGDLAIHMRTHTGEKPYACNICTKRYRMSCHLSAHMKTHTGEKSHICNTCGKAFSDARVLKSHMTTHTGERPFSCTVCQKSFAHYSALSNHRKVHIDRKNVPTNDTNYTNN